MQPEYTIKLGDSPGLLSQVISHALQMSGHFRMQINELMSESSELDRFADLFTKDCNKLQSIQKRLWEFIPILEPLLSEARTLISLNEKEKAVNCISQALYFVKEQSRMMEEDQNSFNTSREVFLPVFEVLHNLMEKYNREMIELDGKVSEAQQMRKKYSDEKYYFLALGVLGLPGLAAAVGLLVAWEEKAKKYEVQSNKFKHIFTYIEQCKNTLTAIQTECENVMNQLSGIQNTLDLLAGDIQKIEEDINHVDSAILSLYLCTASGMLNTLKIDVS